MASNKSAQVAVREPDAREIAIVGSLNDLLDNIPLAGGDGLSIVQDILTADLDSLAGEDATEVTPLESLMGVELWVTEVSRAESDYRDAPGTYTPWYFIIKGTIAETGEEYVTTTSGLTIMLKLARFAVAQALPVKMKVSESRTRNGYDVLNCSVLDYRRVDVTV